MDDQENMTACAEYLIDIGMDLHEFLDWAVLEELTRLESRLDLPPNVTSHEYSDLQASKLEQVGATVYRMLSEQASLRAAIESAPDAFDTEIIGQRYEAIRQIFASEKMGCCLLSLIQPSTPRDIDEKVASTKFMTLVGASATAEDSSEAREETLKWGRRVLNKLLPTLVMACKGYEGAEAERKRSEAKEQAKREAEDFDGNNPKYSGLEIGEGEPLSPSKGGPLLEKRAGRSTLE